MIPESFECAGHTIKVEMHDELPDNRYGAFYDAPGVIKIAKSLSVEDYGKVELTEQQMMNTFWHEYFHCCQFFAGEKYSETQAQTYANFMCELIKTKHSKLPF